MSPAHVHQVDYSLLTADRGIWGLKWSFGILAATALFQVVIVSLTGSVALLADTLHNVGDAFTALPLWIAFYFSKKGPSKRFTYGYGRLEDLAGVFIVLVIFVSAVVAGVVSLQRLFHPQPVEKVAAVAAASLAGFVGNELVARLRIRVGKEIESVAMVADGQHARVDGLTSLVVLVGALGVWLGFPLADPLVGLLITFLIFRIVWEAAKPVLTRLLDGVDPHVAEEIRATAERVDEVREVTEVRVRWLGHRLHAELNIAVPSRLTVEEGHKIAKEVHHQLMHQLSYLSNTTIHVDPASESGETHHQS